MTEVPQDTEVATRSDSDEVAALRLALRLSQMEVAALNEMLDAYRDRMAMWQSNDRLAGAINSADLQRLTHADRRPAAPVS